MEEARIQHSFRPTAFYPLLGLALLGALLMVADEGEAATVTGLQAAYPSGGTVSFTIQDQGTFQSGDTVRVTRPDGCVYIHQVGQGVPSSSLSLSFPSSSFQAAAGNAASCPATPSTHLAGVQGEDAYRISVSPGGCAASCITPGSAQFRIRMTQSLQDTFQRADEITFVSTGWAPNSQVIFQIDSPQQVRQAYDSLLTADAQGVFTKRYVLPQGLNSNADLGAWQIILSSPAAGKTQDRMTFLVEPTQVLTEWLAQPSEPTMRMAQSGASLGLVYAPSVDNPAGPVLMRSSDLTQVQLPIVIERNDGGTWQPLAMQSVASFSSQTGRWNVQWTPPADQELGTYRFRLPEPLADRFGNTIQGTTSQPFQVVGATITPVFELDRQVVERASTSHGLEGKVRLAYPSGVALTAADLTTPSNSDGQLRLGLFRDGQRLHAPFTVAAVAGAGGVWNIQQQSLPAGVPLGDLALRVVEPQLVNEQGNPSPNQMNNSAQSPLLQVVASAPIVQTSFFNKDSQPATSFLRSDTIRFSINVRYDNGVVVKHEDVFTPGAPVGVAQVRVEPPETIQPDGSIRSNLFVLDLQYNDASQRWEANYPLKATDPVGPWRIATVVSDRFGNAHATDLSVSVGLVVTPQISPAAGIQRGATVDVTAILTRPGSDEARTGSNVVLSVNGPSGPLVTDKAMTLDAATTSYRGSFAVPPDAPLGSYRVEVRATSSDDSGFGSRRFDVVTTGIQVHDWALSTLKVERLKPIDLTFGLRYGTGQDVGAGAQVKVELLRGTSVVQTLDATRVDGQWKISHTPSLTDPLGPARFRIVAQDAAGNAMDGFTTDTFEVEPARLLVEGLVTQQTRFDRGQTIRVTATARYSDSTAANTLVIPVKLMAGTTNVASIELRHDATAGLYRGSYRIGLTDPLSTEAAQWSLRSESNSITDASGNKGPAFAVVGDAFAVGPAFLSVDLLEQPSGGLRAARDTVEIKFRLLSSDGAAVREMPQGLQVLVKRGSATLAESTLTLDGDVFTASWPLVRGTPSGDDFILEVGGTDAHGNVVRQTTSQQFDVHTATNKESSGLTPALFLAGLLLLARRRRSIE